MRGGGWEKNSVFCFLDFFEIVSFRERARTVKCQERQESQEQELQEEQENAIRRTVSH